MKIRGKVVDNRGEPASNARVIILDGGLEIAGVSSGPDGRFELEIGHSGKEWKIRASKDGFESSEPQIVRDTDLLLTLTPGPAGGEGNQGPRTVRFSGLLITKHGKPVSGAILHIFDDETEIGTVKSDADGSFDFSAEASAAAKSWRLAVNEKGFRPLNKTFRTAVNTGLQLILLPPAWWVPIKIWWSKSALLVRAAAIAGPLLVIFAVLFVIFRHKGPSNSNDHSEFHRKIHVALKSMNTNFTWVVDYPGLVHEVSVRLNNEKEKVFKNTETELNPIMIEMPPIFHLLQTVTIRVNGLESQTNVIMTAQQVEVREAADRLQECIVSVERLAMAVDTLNQARAKGKPDDSLIRRAQDSRVHWENEYPAQLNKLGDASEDTLKKAGALFKPGGPYTNDPALAGAFAPIIIKHLGILRKTGKMPAGFETDISDAYSKLPNKLQIK